jgi:RNA polymerase sigma factor (sigma-70 family)
MKRAYRKRYKSYFSDIKLPALIPSDLIAEKLLRLRAGDKDIRNDLVLHYLRLVFAIVGRIKADYPKRKHNDLLGTGILSLVECLDSISDGTGMQDHDNLDAYVHKTIYHEIREFIKIDHTVTPPLNSDWLIAKVKEEGTDVYTTLFGTVEYIEVSNDIDYTGDEGEESDGKTYGLFTPSPQEGIEIREILTSFYFTTKEKKIIEMRMEGSTLEDIAKELGISIVAVHKRIRGHIAPRLRTLLGE